MSSLETVGLEADERRFHKLTIDNCKTRFRVARL